MQGIRKNQKCGVGGESRQWILRKSKISSKKCVRTTPKSLDDEVGEDAANATPLTDSPSLKRKAEARNSPYRLRPRVASKDCNSEKKQRIISQKPKIPPPEIVEPKLKTGTRGPVERPAADGYNWRKYGRKHIRVFGKVRNYYKCTYPSCPMRKNVDESLKERMKHTIYIGEHNHDKPQRLRMCWTYLINKFSSRLESSEIILDALVTDANASKSIKTTAFEKDPSTHLQFQSTCHINPLVEEEGMQLSARGCEAVQVTSRRKESVDAATLPPLVLEDGEFIMRSTRGSKNHKDGYSWHKYGEKLIKGNPHPRSYYKCSFIGCPMRKQVNKATKGSTDSVITYHGEHLHELPAFRS